MSGYSHTSGANKSQGCISCSLVMAWNLSQFGGSLKVWEPFHSLFGEWQHEMSISTGVLGNRDMLLDTCDKAAAETALAHPSLLRITGPSLLSVWLPDPTVSLDGCWGAALSKLGGKLRVSTSSSHFTVCCSLDRRRTLGGAHEASRSQVCPTSPGSPNREAGHSAGKDCIERDGCWKLVEVPTWPVWPWEKWPFFFFWLIGFSPQNINWTSKSESLPEQTLWREICERVQRCVAASSQESWQGAVRQVC